MIYVRYTDKNSLHHAMREVLAGYIKINYIIIYILFDARKLFL